MIRRKYIICAPEYSGSTGIRALYRLRDELEKSGCDAFIFQYTGLSGDETKARFVSRITREMRQNDIVVYPETVHGNPLNFHRVVRWVLYFPGKNGGETHYHPGELVFTWAEEYYPGVPELRFNMLDRSLFYKGNEVRDVNCYFVYKGTFRDIPEIKDCIEITTAWPPTRKELADLLRRTKILYSYDWYTLLSDEACMCGVDVKLVGAHDIVDYTGMIGWVSTEKEESEFVAAFINMSQKMNDSGEFKCSNKLPFFWHWLNKINRNLLRRESLGAFLEVTFLDGTGEALARVVSRVSDFSKKGLRRVL